MGDKALELVALLKIHGTEANGVIESRRSLSFFRPALAQQLF